MKSIEFFDDYLKSKVTKKYKGFDFCEKQLRFDVAKKPEVFNCNWKNNCPYHCAQIKILFFEE